MTWVSTRLKFLAEVPITNGLGESGAFDDPAWPRYIRTTDIAGPSALRNDTFASLPPEVAKRAMLRLGDIVMTAAGATIGKSCRYTTDDLACYAGFLVRFRAKRGIDSRFISYWTESIGYWDQIKTGKVVSTIENFSASKYQNLRLEIPSAEEQRAIADYLDIETARIDALITAKQKIMRLVDEFFMSKIASTCDELPNLVPIKRVADTAYGLGQPPTLSEPSSETVPIIRATNINRGVIEDLDLIHACREDLPLGRAPLLQEGEILVVRSGALTGDSVRIVGEWVGSAPGYDLRVTPRSIDSRLLAWQLLGPGVRAQFDLVRMRAAQPHLNAEDLGSVLVRAGSPRDEAIVADQLDVAVARSWKIVATIRTQIDLLRERRQALITAAVTGELEIPEVAS